MLLDEFRQICWTVTRLSHLTRELDTKSNILVLLSVARRRSQDNGDIASN